MRARARVFIYIYIYIHMFIYTRVCMYVCIYIYIYISLALPAKPELLSVPKQPLVRGKDKLSVTCRIKPTNTMREFNIIWRNLDSSFNLTGGTILNVDPVSPEQHDGRWECRGNNSLGEGIPAHFNVTVNGKCKDLLYRKTRQLISVLEKIKLSEPLRPLM